MSSTASDMFLREVIAEDVPIFFEQQLDPEAIYMAAFTARNPADRAAFMAHWARILSDATSIVRTIVHDGRVEGYVSRYQDEDGRPEVAYWLGKEYWGKGIATAALRVFLALDSIRPMYARAAKCLSEKCDMVGEAERSGGARRRDRRARRWCGPGRGS